ncbi:MAG: hypothetical protein LBS60_12900 [Deltaproteobacteria bacterium]|nr:hypothetical protein [Deltaproteobacteria bacterium]
MANSKKPLKPGQKSPGSGQVEIVTPSGKPTGKERTVVKGKRLPPTGNPGEGYNPVDGTKNNSGFKKPK